MHKKKLIEVAIPLDAINKEAAREKSIRHGHPSSLHVWWARRPLAACRAVLFASLVDDPSAHSDRFPTEADQVAERDRLFAIIEDLVKWENSSNPAVLERARTEILASCDGDPPAVLDPFAGGGSIPLEAQRLGLTAHASDLNPVAVLMNKALIEVPPRFQGQSAVNPEASRQLGLRTWTGVQGLAEDVRHYGLWMRTQAERRIGAAYPAAELPKEYGGGKARVIAWLWVRTVECPNPACGTVTPLATTFSLFTVRGRERWVEPQVDGRRVRFVVGGPEGSPPESPKLGRGAKFACVACGQPIDDGHLKSEGMARRLTPQMMAVVAEGSRGRVYLTPDDEQIAAADVDRPVGVASQSVPDDPRNVWCKIYGFEEWHQFFTDRQLATMTAFADLVVEVQEAALEDARAAGLSDDPTPLHEGGHGATAYAEAVVLYLGLCVGKLSASHNTMARWRAGEGKSAPAFGRQAIPMVWDFAEVNPFAGAGGDWDGIVNGAAQVLERLVDTGKTGAAKQLTAEASGPAGVVVSTDPPYYDNIGYGDLSDFFYVWLRRSLAQVFPDECSTLLVPKTQELIASPYRAGGTREAEQFFESGLSAVFRRLAQLQDPRFPLTVYYAFKQAESSVDGTASTGWEKMLQSMLDAGFLIDGTWPMRTEGANRLIASGTNALASSIVLVCRLRPVDAALATRKEFIGALRATLPAAVRALQHGNIAPVDMAQAAIGPGMAVFSSFSKIMEADGAAMRVRSALELINQVLDETIAGTDADFDGDTRWAVTWFEDCGMNEGEFGRAEQLSKSRNTSVPGLAEAGVIRQRPGKVRLTAREELPDGWDPRSDERLTVWEVTQNLIRCLENDGEGAAAGLLRQVGSDLGETAKELAYRLYLVCERKGWAKEAISYNALVSAWPELTRLAASEQVNSEPEGQGQFL